MHDEVLTIKKAAEILGVTPTSLRNWERAGKLKPFHTEGKHRRYYKSDIEKFGGIYVEPLMVSAGNRVAIYCRVSSSDQKSNGDLERQIGRMTTEAVNRGYAIVAILDEVGSGMNANRKKLSKLFEMIENREIDIVLIEHKDRLTRFCINYLTTYFKSFGVRVEWVNEVLDVSTEQELVEDVLSLMVSFSAKIYGRRSSKNKKNNGVISE